MNVSHARMVFCPASHWKHVWGRPENPLVAIAPSSLLFLIFLRLKGLKPLNPLVIHCFGPVWARWLAAIKPSIFGIFRNICAIPADFPSASFDS